MRYLWLKKYLKLQKKTKKTSSKSKTKKTSKTKGKKSQNNSFDAADAGIVVIEDDITIDKQAELEARKLYLEEARSQEASSD